MLPIRLAWPMPADPRISRLHADQERPGGDDHHRTVKLPANRISPSSSGAGATNSGNFYKAMFGEQAKKEGLPRPLTEYSGT